MPKKPESPSRDDYEKAGGFNLPVEDSPESNNHPSFLELMFYLLCIIIFVLLFFGALRLIFGLIGS